MVVDENPDVFCAYNAFGYHAHMRGQTDSAMHTESLRLALGMDKTHQSLALRASTSSSSALAVVSDNTCPAIPTSSPSPHRKRCIRIQEQSGDKHEPACPNHSRRSNAQTESGVISGTSMK
jgi:hypothetical protein